MEPAHKASSPVPQPQPSASQSTTTSPSKLDNNVSGTNPVENDANVSQTPVATSRDRAASGVIPPYWQHARNSSRTSQVSLDRSPRIMLEDHTADPNAETSRGLWAKSVTVDDHVIVQGKTGIGAYVVWNCKVQTLEGGPMTLRMRYSEVDELRRQLQASFPHAQSALPPLPPKSILYRFRSAFLEHRRVGLEYFLNCVLLNPEFSGAPVVKDFLFGRLS